MTYVDDRNTWLSLTDSRGMSLATVHQLPDGQWHARGMDGGGMAITHATAPTALEAIQNGKRFGYQLGNVHDGMETLRRYIDRWEREPGLWTLTRDAFEPDDIVWLPE